jgi:AraC-like DNA-binding protein
MKGMSCMNIEKEIVEISDPELPMKTYIVDSLSRGLAAGYHVHPEIEIIYMINGGMRFWIGGREIEVKEGQVLLINSMMIHSSELLEKTYAKMCLLQFKPDVIYNSGQFNEFKYFAPFLQSGKLDYKLMDETLIKDFTVLTHCLNDIVIDFEQKRIAYEISIKSIIYRILTILYRNEILNFGVVDELYKKKDVFERIQPVLSYVESSYMEEVDLEKACSLLNVNYFYFCRLFKKATGKTFVEYLNYVRLSVAERLLINTDKNVTEICTETGFSSLSYFNRVFKAAKRLNPTEYRKLYSSNC